MVLWKRGDASPSEEASPSQAYKNEEAYGNDVSPPNGFAHKAEQKRHIGVWSAGFLIFNRMVGTGIFATPGTIFRLSGSVGLSLFMWVIGTIIAGCGMAVYLEYGTTITKNGGEKNYLEYVYRKPKFYAVYVLLLGWAGGNSVLCGQYILNAANVEVTRFNQRGIAVGVVTFAFLLNGTLVKWGLRLQNTLGVIKLVILLLIVVGGWAALGGAMQVESPGNFTNAFEGTTASAYSVVNALYSVIWAYVGYTNANYALAETENPARTLKRAAPVAFGGISVCYILANVSYFAAVSRDDIIAADTLISAVFFRNIWGPAAERALSAFVAISAFGNVISVTFSQGRIVQELAREGIIPFSRFFASNKPFNAPFAGQFEHWLVTLVIILAPPPGDAYNFILRLVSYPLNIINTLVGFGLVYLYFKGYHWGWNPVWKASLPVAALFGAVSLYLVIAPLIPPPAGGASVYNDLPYWIHCAVGWGVLFVGGFYWLMWAIVLPKLGGYELVKETVVSEIDGWEKAYFVRRPKTL